MDCRIACRFFALAVTATSVLLSPLSGSAQASSAFEDNATPARLAESQPAALFEPDNTAATPASTASSEPSASSAEDAASLPDAPQSAQQPSTPATDQKIAASNSGQQTKRILFIVPNFRAVSVDQKLPPLTARQSVKLVLQDSFDYSSFIYVGIVAGVAQLQKSYPDFHQGAAGYGRYYWHSFADSVVENTFVEFLIPYPTREDPRYYTLGRGGFGKRLYYSVSRLAITRDNNANNTINLGEIVGAGAASGISNLYYPSRYTTWTKTGQKWVTQIGIDGISNVAKEFWPDINQHLFGNRF